MNKFKNIEKFLKLIFEIKNNGIVVDSNLVYANLIRMGLEKESVEYYFTSWISRFKNYKNISVFNSNNSYCSFIGNNYSDSGNEIKIYIPLDKNHIYAGVNEIFDFACKSEIPHTSKVSSKTRFDDVVLRVPTISDAEKIRNFVNNSSYIREGLINSNPFAFTDGNISFIWDGHLSYNMVVSEYISDYINSTDTVGFIPFFEFICEKYLDIFKRGNGINAFAKSKGFTDYENDLVNYQRITELIILALKGANLKEFYTVYKNIVSKGKDDKVNLNIRKLLKKDEEKSEITPEKKEIFDYIFVEIARKSGIEYAITCINNFIETSNYRVFTRKNNVRELVMQNISRCNMEELMKEEKRRVLNEASLETIKKYDSIQLARALFRLKDGNYSFFTSENNARYNVSLFVKPNELQSIIHSTLLEDGYYNVDESEEIWVYVELLEKLKENLKNSKVA